MTYTFSAILCELVAMQLVLLTLDPGQVSALSLPYVAFVIIILPPLQ